ncbi:hypothetical protein ACERIT_00745 [Halopenitus sp. H-Gu1]|uniref:DUF7093 family protein n=1 Tax=Halopenitus sp. H-Gu1 TaxID=3242697 RepID=UPI00359D59D6
MGLRCLLGHDFGEPTVEREREEEGDQVVITVREIEECDRCGERRVVSENKEVTTLEQLAAAAAGIDDPSRTGVDSDGETGRTSDGPGPARGGGEPTSDRTPTPTPDTASSNDDVGAAPESVDTANPDASTSVAANDAPASTEEDAEIIEETDGELGGGGDGTGTDSPPTGTPEPEANPEAGADSVESDDAAEADDGIILADEPDESAAPDESAGPTETAGSKGEAGDSTAVTAGEDGRGRGEWSASDRGERSREVPDPNPDGKHTPWPERHGEDEGFDANYGDADGDADGQPTVSFGGGLTPEADGPIDYDEETEVIERPSREPAAAASAAGPVGDSGDETVDDPGITAARTVELATESGEVPTEYFCPECGLVQPAGESSMRAGDICPECKRGYIAEQPLGDS